MSGIVYLEKQTVLTSHVYSFYLGSLFERIGIVIEILEVQDGEDGVPGMVVEDDR